MVQCLERVVSVPVQRCGLDHVQLDMLNDERGE
jgi:hypothetical protein